MGKKIGTKRKKILRNTLWAENNCCFYCGVETVLPDSLTQEELINLTDNTATIEHLFAKWKEYPTVNNRFIVISCYKCNNGRAKALSRNERFHISPEVQQEIDRLRELYKLAKETWRMVREYEC